jgi:long-chain fatty acid transport protein
MQMVAAAHAIRPSAKFTNSGSTLAPVQTSIGGNGGDAGAWAMVPNAYLSWQVNPRWHVGVGLNAPFGLRTDYDSGWVGRFHALESDLKTINVNPSVAFRVSDALSVGAGISYQRAEAKLSNAVNYSAAAFAAGGLPLLGAIGGAGVEGVAKVEGDDGAWGYNLGAMFNVGQHTRIGLTYRSAASYKIAGSVVFSNRPALLTAGIPDGPITADVKMPPSASWSIFHQLDPKWDLLADISWTGWSTIKALNIVRTNGALLTTTPLDWSDTWRISVGANYRHADAWTWRAGVAFDQSPVPDADRTPRVPDQDRTWLALGVQYRPSKQSAIDVGYAHLFVRNAASRLCDAAGAAANVIACAGKNSLIGSYDNNVNIVSVQYRYAF